MKRRNLSLFIALIFSVFFFFSEKYLESDELYYNDKPVQITFHAACRMECREVNEADINSVLKYGVVNVRKSNYNDTRGCPTIALEGRTDNKQSLRVIVADCEEFAKIVTVIDLSNDYPCGDCN